LKTDTIILVAPDFAALDTAGRRSDPAVLWPVGGQPFAAHWMDYAVRLGCKRVTLHAVDRPAEVRASLGSGAAWSLQLEIVSGAAPAEAIAMVGLPGELSPTAPTTPAELLEWWFALNTRWLAGRDPQGVSIDHFRQGGWIGPRARIHPSALLTAPFWIGAGTEIGADCRIGPDALVGPGCLLEKDIHLENSLVLPRTFLGPHLDLRARIVDGGTVLDRATGTRVAIADKFIASTLGSDGERVSWHERLLAAVLWLPAVLLALGAGAPVQRSVRLPGGKRLSLDTRPRGPLLARRSAWLGQVIAGRLRLVGILPREVVADVLPENRRLLEDALPGVFALSDVHGVHSPDDAEESVHAIYQVTMPESDGLVRKSLLRLCLVCPTETAR
jgi:hypothetical protein